jgi:hypothetical protein
VLADMPDAEARLKAVGALLDGLNVQPAGASKAKV